MLTGVAYNQINTRCYRRHHDGFIARMTPDRLGIDNQALLPQRLGQRLKNHFSLGQILFT